MKDTTSGETSNGCSGSTTWEWRKVIITSHPQGSTARAKRVPSLRGRRQRDRFKPFTVEIRYRGGPEASYLLKAGDSYRRIPGHWAFHDAIMALWAIK